MPNSSNPPPPYSWPPSQNWDGNAGQWSSFILRAGTPAQDFRIFPSTEGNQIWLPVPEGCLVTDPSNCGDLRGVFSFGGAPSNGFQSNASSTWESKGIFGLDTENGLNFTGNGDFGFDTIGLGMQNSNGATLTHQLLAGIATKDFYLGEFGLGVKPSNLSSFDDPIPNYFQSLRKQSVIPSLSYGYTAGAKYQLNGVLGSLTLGGYDASRFQPSNISFLFDADNSRHLTVGLQSLLVSNTPNGTIMPITTGEYFLIDSSVTDIWLPQTVCQALEEALGLTYDHLTDLYIVSSSTHERLQTLNPTFTFQLGAAKFGGQTIPITLPYAAFDLQASSPIYPNATNYFPIRQAANETQYILGRTFLQEAYIIVDYERSNFSVAPAMFEQGRPTDLIAIYPVNGSQPSSTNALPPSTPATLSRGAVVGMVVGAVFLLAVIVGFLLLKRRWKKQNIQHHEMDVEEENIPQMSNHSRSRKPEELDSQAITNMELGADIIRNHELDSKPQVSEIGLDHVEDSFRIQNDVKKVPETERAENVAEQRATVNPEYNPGPFFLPQTNPNGDGKDLLSPVSVVSQSSGGETWASRPPFDYPTL